MTTHLPAQPAARDPDAATTLQVVHKTRYRYSAPVSLAHHLAHLRPLNDAHQQRLAFHVDVDPTPSYTQWPEQDDGAWLFSLAQPHRTLKLNTESTVRVWPRFAGLRPELSPAWDELAQSLRFTAGRATPLAAAYAYPSPYVPRLAALRDFARPSFRAGRPVAEAAMELMQRVYSGFRYESESTDIDTPVADVLKHRRGVCQDFAHLMCGALRMLGLPARYVSGYLLTRPPDGGEALVGADATHAWVQLWCPDTQGVPDQGNGAGWLDLDPTNNRVPGTGYVRLATGRDFGDVTPLRGIITGGGHHTINVGVSTRLLPCAGNT